MNRKLTTKIITLILNIYSRLYRFGCKCYYNPDEFNYINIPFFVCYVSWSYLYSDMHEELYQKYLSFLGDKHHFSTFLSSYLHEIGHHKVGNIRQYSKMIDITKYKEVFDIKSKDELDLLIYYNIPDEYEATKWAVDFINTHCMSLTVLSYILYPFINYAYWRYWDLIMEEMTIYEK